MTATELKRVIKNSLEPIKYIVEEDLNTLVAIEDYIDVNFKNIKVSVTIGEIAITFDIDKTCFLDDVKLEQDLLAVLEAYYDMSKFEIEFKHIKKGLLTIILKRFS